jgi:F-type H+-transporting ATPase subunit gamma
MAGLREIKKRMSAVKNIQRITRTMQMIATAKFTAAQQRAEASKPYSTKVQQLVRDVTAACDDVDHPLVNGPGEKQGRELLLVIGSDRGLCGAYNANVLRTAMNHIRDVRDEKAQRIDVETSGKKPVAYFRFQKVDLAERLTIGDKPTYDQISDLAERYINAFAAGHYDAIRVAYMRFESTSRQTPVIEQLMPLQAEQAENAGDESRQAQAVYDFSPSSEELLRDLLPLAVKTHLFQAFNDAVVSEQIMRMVAMNAATENAKDFGQTLKRNFNRARQSQITTELMEVIGGSAALE